MVLLLAWQHPAAALNVEALEPEERARLEAVMHTLSPIVEAKKADGTANVLTWEALEASLDADGRAFLAAMRALKAEPLGSTSHYYGNAQPVDLTGVELQYVLKSGAQTPVDAQYLPRKVLTAYRAMMGTMKRDLGTSLRIESGYRTPAYQLYLFLFYLPKHGYSIRETNRFVALPGYSEHGAPDRQAIDFINEHGINGEDHPEQFEALPEYAWLQAHAATYGFFLSYPRDNPLHTSFEPWHWHYEK